MKPRKELDIGKFLAKVNHDFERSGLPKIAEFSFFEEKPNVMVTLKDESGLMGFGFARYSYEDEKDHRTLIKLLEHPRTDLFNRARIQEAADAIEYDPMRGIVTAAKKAIERLRKQPLKQKVLNARENESVILEDGGRGVRPRSINDRFTEAADFMSRLFDYETARQAGEVPGVPGVPPSPGVPGFPPSNARRQSDWP